MMWQLIWGGLFVASLGGGISSGYSAKSDDEAASDANGFLNLPMAGLSLEEEQEAERLCAPYQEKRIFRAYGYGDIKKFFSKDPSVEARRQFVEAFIPKWGPSVIRNAGQLFKEIYEEDKENHKLEKELAITFLTNVASSYNYNAEVFVALRDLSAIDREAAKTLAQKLSQDNNNPHQKHFERFLSFDPPLFQK